jgi:hypothetical protein
MWMEPVPDGDRTPISVPPALRSAIVLTAVATLVLGIYPNAVDHFSQSTKPCISASAAETVGTATNC